MLCVTSFSVNQRKRLKPFSGGTEMEHWLKML